MNKVINIKTKKAIKEIREFKIKKYTPVDVKFENIHLRELNKLTSVELFDKNDLYINSYTLWELMQPIGSSGAHNYHELKAEDIFNALNNLINPQCVFKVKSERIAIIPVFVSSFDEPLMVVVEIGSGLIKNKKANINKVVTMYPKSNLEEYLEKMNSTDILYRAKKETTGT